MNNGAYNNPVNPSPPLSLSPSPSPYISPSSPTSGTSFFSQISLTMWIIIILILAILGFNVFVYLAKGTQTFSDIFGPAIRYISGWVAYITAVVTKQVVNVSATGTKAGVDIAAGTVTGSIDTAGDVAKQIDTNRGNTIVGANASKQTATNQNVKGGSSSQNNTNTNNALSDALERRQSHLEKENTSYEADEASSSIQASKSSGKSGWCYIGEDRGFRSCIQVGENDKCMSGDIFPDHDICVNPNLRK